MAVTGPCYRLRLFLSVDLAGSTSFKNGAGNKHKDGDPFPNWVGNMRQFYRDFPLLVNQHYRDQLVGPSHLRSEDIGNAPIVWKTIGDELLFCVRLRSLEHLAACITSFLKSLRDYGQILDSQGRHMDVKGAGWIAAFPAPNVTVTSFELSQTTDYLDEILEAEADKQPDRFDFLGRDIDSGFRVARHASTDNFVTSIELAWLLAQCDLLDYLKVEFEYHGRHLLKGVIKDRPYPVISIDTERSPSRRCVKEYERNLIPFTGKRPLAIRDFCAAFMSDEEIELPILLPNGEERNEATYPRSYKQFIESATITLKENSERDANAEAANKVEDDVNASNDLPSEVLEFETESVRARAEIFLNAVQRTLNALPAISDAKLTSKSTTDDAAGEA